MTTPTPWYVGRKYIGTVEVTVAKQPTTREGDPLGDAAWEANAELIVRAVNAHEALLTAARAAAEELDALVGCRNRGTAIEFAVVTSTERLIAELRAAIALAEGKA